MFFALALAVAAGPHGYVPPPPPPVQAAPAKPTRYRLLVLDLKSSDVDKATVDILQGLVAAGLSEYPELDVVSGDDVKQLVSLQASRQTVGCSEDASCLAEIADALGAQLVVFGNVGKLGDSLVMNINLFDSIKAAGLGRIVVQAEDTKRIPKKLKPKLRDLVGRFYSEHKLDLPPVIEEKEEVVAVAPAPVVQVYDPGPWPAVTTIAGVVLLGAGAAAAVAGALPYQTFQADKTKVTSLEQKFAKDSASSDVTAARTEQIAMLAAVDQWNSTGYILFDVGAPVAGVGLVAAVGGAIWWITAPSPDEIAKAKAPTAAPSTAPTAAPTAGGAR
ncbi:MAG TPA: hypothetical protein VGO62_01740 [Myxococcota bacterium]|jgi:hypothetical protein